jgi:hypothetical protein
LTPHSGAGDFPKDVIVPNSGRVKMR